MTLEELLTIEEIKALRGAYSAHFDEQNIEALVALFTDDAVLDFGSYGTWRGRAEIERNYRREIKVIGLPFDAMHVTTNPWIHLDGETRAHGRWYLIDIAVRQDPHTGLKTRGGHDNPLLFLGIYEDDYRKVDGRWLISHTKLHFLWPERSFTGLRHPA